ncbi:hypothetical protein Tco_0710203 [Tanacetum coccineum]
MSNSGLEEFQQPEFKGYGPKHSKSVSEDTSNEVRESPDAPLVKKLMSDDKLDKKIVFPTVAKIEFVRPKQQEKPHCEAMAIGSLLSKRIIEEERKKGEEEAVTAAVGGRAQGVSVMGYGGGAEI